MRKALVIITILLWAIWQMPTIAAPKHRYHAPGHSRQSAAVMIHEYKALISSAKDALDQSRIASRMEDDANSSVLKFTKESDDEHIKEATKNYKSLVQTVNVNRARAKRYVLQAITQYHLILGSHGFNNSYRLTAFEFSSSECFPDIPAMRNLQFIEQRVDRVAPDENPNIENGNEYHGPPTTPESQDLARVVQSYNDNLREIGEDETLAIDENNLAAQLYGVDDNMARSDANQAQSYTTDYKRKMKACVEEYKQIIAMPGFDQHYMIGDYAFKSPADDFAEVPGAALIHLLIER